MLSDLAFYNIAAITFLVIWNIYFIFSLLYPHLKKLRSFLFFTLLLTPIVIKTCFSNTVYIINDANEIEKLTLVIPYKFRLVNGHYSVLKPKPGFAHFWLINNGERKAWVESITYGNNQNSTLSKQVIEPYSAAIIDNIEYFFEAPPQQIRAINRSVTKGWLHR